MDKVIKLCSIFIILVNDFRSVSFDLKYDNIDIIQVPIYIISWLKASMA